MDNNLISRSFKTFQEAAPGISGPWAEFIMKSAKANALDKKTAELVYLAVLAAIRLDSGIPFHVKMAREAGATREEIISAILTGLPAAGHAVINALPAALDAYDN